MSIDLPIDAMSSAEKLQLMEALWQSLARSPTDIPSPNWHGYVLEQRRQAVREGRAAFEDWDSVKQRLRSRSKQKRVASERG
jgi:putative addiction module component (TIGR02574 family)